MTKGKELAVLERFLPESPSWRDGYAEFCEFFGKPLGWFFLIQNGGHRLVRLDRKGNCSFYAKSKDNQTSCALFLEKYFEQLQGKPEEVEKLPQMYHCGYGRSGAIFALRHLTQLKGFLILCAVHKPEREIKPFFKIFDQFLRAEVDLAYRTFELQNFYETVHPRALALSTIHSVHRVMASSLRLSELLPRIGRLCVQVIKAKKCAVFLLDADKKYLIPKFSFGAKDSPKRKLKVGHGVEGHVAETAEFHLSRNCIAVPFIEEDIVGVIELKDKLSGTPFTQTDLELLKTLSEQAVVAIKNAQLFEETEALTLSSIKTINELLSLTFSGGRSSHPIISELAFRIGRDLCLSGFELTHLHRATFLIDAGQLGTPGHILSKKTKLTAKEYEEVKQHPNRGASILQQISSLRPAIPMILHHHERYDGTGYPDRLKGDEIPMGARIISVADAFAAMVSHRPYRQGRAVEEAIEEIKANTGTQFDPKVVGSFLKVIRHPDMVELLKHPNSARVKDKWLGPRAIGNGA